MPSIGDTSNTKKTADVGPTEAAMRWIEIAAGEVAEIKKSAAAASDSAVASVRAGASQILAAASSTIEDSKGLVELVKSQYAVHEDLAVAKIKEGILIATSHPEISCGIAAGVGLVAFKRPRRFLVRNTRRLFMSEESLLSDAEAKVNKLRQSINLVKNESRKLEERARKAEEEMERGRQALTKEGRGIQSEIRFASGIEKEANGLKEIIRDLPRRDASKFRSEVSALVSQVKQEKKVLTRTATKIINYGLKISPALSGDKF